MRQPLSGSGLLVALTCRPSVLPHAGFAFRVGLLDSASPSPACRILELCAWSAQRARSPAPGAQTCFDFAAPASSRRFHATCAAFADGDGGSCAPLNTRPFGVRPFGQVPKILRPLLSCAPSPPANLSGDPLNSRSHYKMLWRNPGASVKNDQPRPGPGAPATAASVLGLPSGSQPPMLPSATSPPSAAPDPVAGRRSGGRTLEPPAMSSLSSPRADPAGPAAAAPAPPLPGRGGGRGATVGVLTTLRCPRSGR